MANQEQVELLKQGIEGWNRWRKEDPDVEINLIESNFTEANLSGAIFFGAKLSFANFDRANLVNARLDKANLIGANLVSADLSNAYLVLATFYGANLIDANLSFANLKSADLGEANLIGANLSFANLESANLESALLKGTDLSNANLVTTQALGTNFTNTILTGACLEDWNINSKTKLDGVICEYVYLKQGKQERRPSSGNFKSGEFAALFQKALETVDLIFSDGIDWQAFFQSFQELRSQYNDLSIQAIEKKSGGAFVIRLEVPPEADKAEIESHAKELYEMRLQLQEQHYKAELQAKDGQISLYQEQLEFHRQNNTSLMEIVKTMAEKENQPTYQTTINAQTIGVTHTGSGDVTGFTMNVNSNIDDITKLITALRDTAQTFPSGQREEALGHLEDLEGDLKSPSDNRTPRRIKAALAALLTIAGMVAATTDFTNNVLEIGDKLGIELIQILPNQQLPPSK